MRIHSIQRVMDSLNIVMALFTVQTLRSDIISVWTCGGASGKCDSTDVAYRVTRARPMALT